ncbi:MAG: hypothetical protein P8Y60_10075 [Calditrichota bacterium]
MKKIFLKYALIIFFIQFWSDELIRAQVADSLLDAKAKTLLKLLSVVSRENFQKIDTLQVAILGDFSDSTNYADAKFTFNIFRQTRAELQLPTFHFVFHLDDYHSYHQKTKPTWDAVLLVDVDSVSTRGILDYCDRDKIISITLNPNRMSSGFAIGVDVDREFRPRILLNVGLLKNAGYFFETEVLQVSCVKKLEF